MTICGGGFEGSGLYAAGVCSSEVSLSKATIFNLRHRSKSCHGITCVNKCDDPSRAWRFLLVFLQLLTRISLSSTATPRVCSVRTSEAAQASAKSFAACAATAAGLQRQQLFTPSPQPVSAVHATLLPAAQKDSRSNPAPKTNAEGQEQTFNLWGRLFSDQSDPDEHEARTMSRCLITISATSCQSKMSTCPNLCTHIVTLPPASAS